MGQQPFLSYVLILSMCYVFTFNLTYVSIRSPCYVLFLVCVMCSFQSVLSLDFSVSTLWLQVLESPVNLVTACLPRCLGDTFRGLTCR